MTRRISRREFLVVSGATVATGLAAACGPSEPDVPADAAPADAPAADEPAMPMGKYREAPELSEMVQAGLLPPVDERLPADPWVLPVLREIGKYGGELSSIVADPTANLFEISNARGANAAGRSYDLGSIIPIAVESFSVNDDSTVLSVSLRAGQKWSDGTPFTTEHVSFWYEDILLNEELTPVVNKKLAPGGETLTLEVEDDFNFKLVFAVPYPVIIDILPSLALWAPKHYLSQWHSSYNENADAKAKEENFDAWYEAFQYHADAGETQQDVDLPVLGPWVFEKQDTQGNTTYVRNPYYWAVDAEGNQLPYVDRLQKLVVENREVLTAKILAGEGTHHSWFLSLADFPLYKQNEASANFTARLHPDLRASEMGLAFNYTHTDPVLRELFNDVRWRQALSHALDRNEINELRFAGRGVPRNPIMHPGPLFWQEGLDQMFTTYDVELANSLLDQAGLTAWDSDGKFRLRPDGEPLALTMEVDAGRADLSETGNLIKAYWADVGVNINVKGQDQQFYMQRMRANEHDIGVWAIGGSSEPYSRQNEPIRYRPPWHWSSTPLGGPLWRQWLDTDGAEGMEPPDIIKELWETTVQWQAEPFGTDRYKELGLKMLQINAENVWLIGTVGLVPRASIIRNTVRNAPDSDNILSIEYGMWTHFQQEQWWIDS
ncbi:MAG: ABC transporter substrate-binding protein [Caldilineaceae bacterium SB0662_bin_9]|uniref:ABC transporter substrate-binding protein n=1 Tax=Caldilineaceae bacterium SB0662_bin_9 TaxID=2605258 RepID=A0A6B1DUR0_9CHLR|nr:ABC transporter substrate-binding protein [Caldilineaceae bacterium SB0662_bin_9]